MKRLADLTAEDLATTPVWRYQGETEAEATVVPEERDSLSRLDEEVFLAATEFLLPDSSKRLGFCFPVDDAGILKCAIDPGTLNCDSASGIERFSV